MPNITCNTWFRDEAWLLDVILPIWKMYEPVTKFIFYDDGSTDNSCSLIKAVLGNRAEIVGHERIAEASAREAMYNASPNGLIVSLDCDELISDALVEILEQIETIADTHSIITFCSNVVDSLHWRRNDPAYRENYRELITYKDGPWKASSSSGYHTASRLPARPGLSIKLQKNSSIIHLQALSKRFYALKQLWYKHYEHKIFGKSIEQLNSSYDPVVNNLDFMPVENESTSAVAVDPAVFESSVKIDEFLSFIRANYNPRLITFGAEYL